ncbi:hypothetical protein B0O80DRAFT_429173 [Mortierella sp. GBAus27b]|nr:hypothetical protein B0O80DRAFT_429173 [Mortierella sp. GBAus27b]
MNAGTTTQPKQKFRCRATGDILAIATHLDPNTGERVVLWEDIQAGFKNADSIRDEDSLVSFLRDASLKEIIPRRIAYYPGTVLDVIVDDHNHGHSLSHGHNQLNPEVTLLDVAVTADSNTDDKPLVLYSSSVDGSHPSSVGVSNAPSLLQDVVSNFSRQIEGLQMQLAQSQLLQEDANKMLDKAAEERAKNQEEVKEMQRRQQETSDQLVKKQEEMNEMQKMPLDRLAIIHSRVQAVVTQTYELHEYPIPRLFIILPKATGVFDKIKNPFANQFRLYFLCECGTHTMDENSKTQHEIHFAKHDGYDLEKPNEFFQRYGSYVLALMNMIKYGITAAGLVVSPLSGLKIVEGIDTTQQHMDYLKKNISPLVDNAINYLEGFKRKTDGGEEIAEGDTEFDQLEALEGADLRQLESYLKVKDQGRVLANLYRIVTFEGHVKWVCFDHYKATYCQSAVQHLREIVEVNRGTFIEETGTIQIKIATRTLAKQFYDAMVKARGIQELEITLQWDATMNDLRLLSNAISSANVVHVTVDGSYFKSSLLDFVNRGQRFNPILQLTSNTRVQSLRLGGFDGFFSRITESALAPAPRLRVFRYDAPLTSKDKDLPTIDGFLGCCSALTTLELSLDPGQSITNTISELLMKVQTLESLKIVLEGMSITVGFSNGKVEKVDLTIPLLGVLDLNDLKFVRREHLIQLSVMYVPSDEFDQLEGLLRDASNLKHLRIGCDHKSSVAIVDRVISTREKIMQDTGSSCLQSFELMQKGLVPLAPFNEAFYDRSDCTQSHVSFQDGSNVFDMRTWTYMRDYISQEFLRRYGWSIVSYDGVFGGYAPFSDILKGLSDTKTLQFESLWIQSRKADADVVDEIIRRSPNFKDLGLVVHLEYLAAEQPLLSRHAPILSMLCLEYIRDYTGRWEWFASSFPTRDTLPALKWFKLGGGNVPLTPPSDCIPWIVAMVSVPHQQLISPSQLTIQGVIDSQVTNLESVAQRPSTRLKQIGLDYLRLQTEDWKSVVMAIDFSELEILSFFWSNIPLEALRLLVNRIPDNTSLKILDLSRTPDRETLDPFLVYRLQRKVPSLTIK